MMIMGIMGTMGMMRRVVVQFGIMVVSFFLNDSYAGVFTLPHYVQPGEFSIGLEPELTLSSGAGIGMNAKYTQGLNDLLNVTGVLGTGSGPRKFRVGGNLTFDFFPDVDHQPGIGLSTQFMYYRLKDDQGQVEVNLIPYIHKAFITEAKNEVEPFVAVPFGMAFLDGNYKAISSVAIGAIFKNSDQWRYVMEFGIAVNRTDSYVSGGVVYYH